MKAMVLSFADEWRHAAPGMATMHHKFRVTFSATPWPDGHI